MTQMVELERQKELLNIPKRYRGNPDNTPDTLGPQLELLQAIVFKEVDCYYKYRLFCLFGGRK